jgi:hypothetical protein
MFKEQFYYHSKTNKMGKINWLAIIAAVVAGSLIGFLWYGALFMDKWALANNLVVEGEKVIKNGVEVPANNLSMLWNSLSMVVYALFMNWLINKTGDKTWQKGATLGAIIGAVNWIGHYVNNSFAHIDGSLALIDGSYAFVLWTVMGAIIGGWRKD